MTCVSIKCKSDLFFFFLLQNRGGVDRSHDATKSTQTVFQLKYWPCHIPSCLWVWWQGRPWLTVAKERQQIDSEVITQMTTKKQQMCAKQHEITTRNKNSSTVKELCVSPWRRGSRSWMVPPSAASCCRRSSSSPLAGSSGCHCKLTQMTLAPACERTENTEMLLRFLNTERRSTTYFFIEPFPMPRSEKRKFKQEVLNVVFFPPLNEHMLISAA